MAGFQLSIDGRIWVSTETKNHTAVRLLTATGDMTSSVEDLVRLRVPF